MKVVLLAGGRGTRISEETEYKPKPMIEIGGMPIIWHIMKEYSYCGYNDFIICAGYKQHIIKKWFADYYLHTCDVTFDFTQGNKVVVHNQFSEPWKVTIVDCGLETATGGRIKRVQSYIGDNTFMLTYGDGVCDVDIHKLVEFHKEHGKMATLTSVTVKQEKGMLNIDANGTVRSFREKQSLDNYTINAGYLVLNPQIFEYIEDDNTSFEGDTLEKIAAIGELKSFRHYGYWQCMDTKLEKDKLEELWKSGKAPWKTWS